MWQAMQSVLGLTGHDFPGARGGISAAVALEAVCGRESLRSLESWHCKHLASYAALASSSAR